MQEKEHTLRYVSVEEISEYKNNARIHDSKQIDILQKSIREFGFINPIIVDSKQEIIAGHGRLQAARGLGLQSVPVLIVEDLTEDQIKAYRLADNKIVELGQWDTELLSVELSELNENIFDLAVIGFDMAELNEFVEAVNNFDGYEGDTVPDGDKKEVEEMPVVDEGEIVAAGEGDEPVSVEGEVYILGDHRLMCGDCTNALHLQELFESHHADCVFTDPPYGVDYDGGFKKRDKLDNDHKGTDIYESFLSLALLYTKVDAGMYLFYAGGKFAKPVIDAVIDSGGWEIKSQIIWYKNVAQFGGFVAMNLNYKQKHEPLLYCKKTSAKEVRWFGPNNETTVWEIDRLPKNEHHPTEKPIALAQRAIRNSTEEGDIVADFFGGSGSTLIASASMGRRAFVIEKEPKYCDIIRRRWAKYAEENGLDIGDGITDTPF